MSMDIKKLPEHEKLETSSGCWSFVSGVLLPTSKRAIVINITGDHCKAKMKVIMRGL